jgi:tRNA dimethylallyltransferase
MNTSTSSLPPLALIAGPTASGKSALALMLAERMNGAIVNADSAQVYRDLRILSARPSAADEARAPHLLYGHRDGALPCSAADWATDAKAAIRQVQAKGQLPILAGGTGLYLRTLLEGIAPIPAIDPEIRSEIRSWPVASAYEALSRDDPAAAARLRPTDTTRVARALEVVRSTGQAIGEWQRLKSGGMGEEVELRPLLLLPPRDWLYERCDCRLEAMFAAEGEAEVWKLLERGLDPALPVMRAIGVREIGAWLTGEMERDEAMAAARTATRQYAKRQYTWFSRQPPSEWPRFREAPEGSGFEGALALLRD